MLFDQRCLLCSDVFLISSAVFFSTLKIMQMIYLFEHVPHYTLYI